MKSIVEDLTDFEKMLFPASVDSSSPGKLMVHYELYKKISHLEGNIVRCGVAAEEGFTHFALLRNVTAASVNQKIISFEKLAKSCYLNAGNNNIANPAISNVKREPVILERFQQKLLKKGLSEKIEFIPGTVAESISEYLIENPEMKISYLEIDFNDYDSTSTTLQFFYPRLVHGGILILDNYYKKEEDYNAVKDYFKYTNTHIYNFSVNKGPHYIVRL